MYTVTQRVNSIQQPPDGYIPINFFNVKRYNDNKFLNSRENIQACYVGLVVDYLTRYYITNDVKLAFDISMLGAEILYKEYGRYKDYRYCLSLLEAVKQGDISAAVQLVAYDEVYRAGIIDIPKLLPDRTTIENIEIMAQRGVKFLRHCSTSIKTGFDLEGSYTDIVVNGDCDYLTQNALIDFKVIRGNITTKYTLQILMYYLMGLHSVHKTDFQKVKWLAFFNPRKNIVYFMNTGDIPESVASEVASKVIGY